jgi:hypothetical protein
LKLRRPAFLALAGAQMKFLSVMHQHVENDIFRHPMGEIANRHANQRDFRQRLIGHQCIDTSAQVENNPQVGKPGQLAGSRLPYGRIVNLGGIALAVRQKPDRAVGARLVKSALPSPRGPVFGSTVNEQSKRSLVHRNPASLAFGNRADPAGLHFRYKNISAWLSEAAILARPWMKRKPPPMLYAILCYHDEDLVGSWTRDQDAAVMSKLAVVQDRLKKQGRLGPVARLLPTTAATTLRKDDPPLVLDGPYAETKEQLLGFYIVECENLDAAVGVARDLGAANPGGAYEIRPVGLFQPGEAVR